MQTKRQWRVIAKPVMTVILKTRFEADTAQDAVEQAIDLVDWYDLGKALDRLKEKGYPPGSLIEDADFGEEFAFFVVDPIGDDGEPDIDEAVWLEGDGETPYSAKDIKAETVEALAAEAVECFGQPCPVFSIDQITETVEWAIRQARRKPALADTCEEPGESEPEAKAEGYIIKFNAPQSSNHPPMYFVEVKDSNWPFGTDWYTVAAPGLSMDQVEEILRRNTPSWTILCIQDYDGDTDEADQAEVDIEISAVGGAP